jgi:multidrug resistance efflux pump
MGSSIAAPGASKRHFSWVTANRAIQTQRPRGPKGETMAHDDQILELKSHIAQMDDQIELYRLDMKERENLLNNFRKLAKEGLVSKEKLAELTASHAEIERKLATSLEEKATAVANLEKAESEIGSNR